MTTSVAHIQACQLLLQEAVGVYDALLALYGPDTQTEQDFTARTVSATKAQRAEAASYLTRANELSPVSGALLIQSMGRYLDSHWDDYREIPVADPVKFARREQLHTALERVINKLCELQNKLEAGVVDG